MKNNLRYLNKIYFLHGMVLTDCKSAGWGRRHSWQYTNHVEGWRESTWDFLSMFPDLRCVLRCLEVDRHVTMSRAPPVIHDLSDTFRIMAGVTRSPFQDQRACCRSITSDEDHKTFHLTADICGASNADKDKYRDEYPKMRLHHDAMKPLAKQIVEKESDWFGDMWRTVTKEAGQWRPDSDQLNASVCVGCGSVHKGMHESRRYLVFHVS